MTLESLFYNSNGEAKVQPYCYLLRSDKLDSLKRVEQYDKSAKDFIKGLKAYITVLEEYRQSLYDRAQFIIQSQTVYEMHLCITRRIDYYHNRKYYTVTIYKAYNVSGIGYDKILSEEYTGKERHKALARFEELKKLYPNILTKKDIDKSKWEN